MLKLRTLLLFLLFPLVFTAVDSAYAQSEPVQTVISKENQPTVLVVNAQAPVSAYNAPSTIMETLELPTDFQQTAALYALLGNSNVAELKQFVAEAKTIPDSNDRQTGLSIIYGRFAELDPQLALTHLLSADVSNSRNIIYSMFFSWSKLDLTAAIKQCRSLSGPNHQQIATRAILTAQRDKGMIELEQIAQRLGPMAVAMMGNMKVQSLAEQAKTNPQVAIKEALEIEDSQQRDQAVNMIAKQWATEDPIAALEYSESIESGQERRAFRSAAMNAMARQDPEGMLDLIDSRSVTRNEQFSLIHQVMRKLGEIDPQYALEKAQSLSREQERNSAVRVLLSYVARSDLETAIEMLDSLPDSDIRQQGQQVLERFARSDPERALQWAEVRSAQAPDLLTQVITSIASSDPEHAFELIADMPSSQTKTDTLKSVLITTARNDPQLAASYLKSVPKGPVHQQVAQNIASSWFQADPDSALAWIFSLDKQLQSRLLIDFAFQVVNYELAYAQSLLPLLPSTHVQNAWISAIVDRYPKHNDPLIAVEWLEQYKDEPKYNDWMNRLLAVIAGTGSVEDAIALADNISGESEYDSAILAIVNRWSTKDIQGAANWVQRESETSNRDQLIKAVAGQWSAYDVKSAQQWVMRFPESEQRDVGLSTLIESEYISTQDADNILRKMISPTLRFDALQAYISNLARYDSSAARLFLKRQFVLSDQNDALLSVIENIENGG